VKGKPLVGVWLDHRQAVLFWADEQANTEVQELESGYQEEGEPSDSKGAPRAAAFGGGVMHANLAARRKEQLKHYYKKLDEILRSAQEIFLFGPGQAKKELATLIEQDKAFRGRLKGIENVDKKMTRRQMMARAREFFALPRP